MIYLYKMAWKYAKEDQWKIVCFHILHSISLGGQLLKPYAFGRFINVLQDSATVDVNLLFYWLGIYILGFVIFEVFHRAGQYFVVTTALKTKKRFIDAMYDKMCNLSTEWHKKTHSGESINRILIASSALRDFGFTQREYIEYVFLAVGPMLVLCSISWEIAGICLVLSIINLMVVNRMNKAITKILQRKTEYDHIFSARFMDFISHMQTLITLKAGRKTYPLLDESYKDTYREGMKEFSINQPRCFVISFGLILTELLIIIVYLYQHSYSGIMVGTLVMMVNYWGEMSDSFFNIMSSFYETLHWKTNLMAVEPILKAYNEEKTIPCQNYSGDIVNSRDKLMLSRITVKYDHIPVLNNLSLTIEKGKKIAVIGTSGTGKSTFLQTIKSALDNKALYLEQDAQLFNQSLCFNVTFETVLEDLNKLSRVLDWVGLDHLVTELPEGIHTILNEDGMNFSGGEKQRIALARTLFARTSEEILLLDEATSNVDMQMEKQIYENIFKYYSSMTVIATVHSYHVLPLFDHIILLSEGQVLEQGSFHTLMGNKNYFAKLWSKYSHMKNNATESNLLSS